MNNTEMQKLYDERSDLCHDLLRINIRLSDFTYELIKNRIKKIDEAILQLEQQQENKRSNKHDIN